MLVELDFLGNDNSRRDGSSQNALYARVVVRDVEKEGGFDSSLALHKQIS